MSFKKILRFGPARRMLYRLARWRIQEKLAELTPHLTPREKILDIGAGNCVLCEALRDGGYRVTPLDLDNQSFLDDIEPVIYDGDRIPFDDDSFDVALLITVLHHATDPDALLTEARRVARKTVVIEEIYTNPPNRWATWLIDSLFNFEFFGHPRNNRTDRGWKEAFERQGLRLQVASYSRSLFVLHRVTYILEKGTPIPRPEHASPGRSFGWSKRSRRSDLAQQHEHE